VGSIRIDVEGLSALGGVCHREAEQLVVGHSDRLVGPDFQPTTAALEQIAAVTRGVEGLISLRLQVTGHKFVTAAERFGEREATSRQQIASVSDDLTVT
jgi:hypothetical protein